MIKKMASRTNQIKFYSYLYYPWDKMVYSKNPNLTHFWDTLYVQKLNILNINEHVRMKC